MKSALFASALLVTALAVPLGAQAHEPYYGGYGYGYGYGRCPEHRHDARWQRECHHHGCRHYGYRFYPRNYAWYAPPPYGRWYDRHDRDDWRDGRRWDDDRRRDDDHRGYR